MLRDQIEDRLNHYVLLEQGVDLRVISNDDLVPSPCAERAVSLMLTAG